MRTTENCCLCLGQPARVITGHVSLGDESVLAGWCDDCDERMRASCSSRLRGLPSWSIEEFLRCDLVGWVGHWVPAMGLRPWSVDDGAAKAEAPLGEGET